VDAALTGADDYINGSYLWNVTTSHGSLITDFVAATDTVILATADAAMASGDTYYILDAWKTLQKYTTTTARTAGDIAYVRANTTQTSSAADVVFDEDGTAVAPISIIGCDATVNDPWGDASDVLPIISFGDQAYFMNMAGDDYWTIKRLNIKESNKNDTAILQIDGCIGTLIDSCVITDNSHAAGMGIRTRNVSRVTINNCVFKDNLKQNVHVVNVQNITNINNCTFDGGTTGTGIGVSVEAGAHVYIEGCTFGSTTSHGTQDIQILTAGIVYTRNCTYNKTSLLSNVQSGYIYSEDDDGTFGNQISYFHNGTVAKSATARTGGATSSAQMLPTSLCNVYYPLSLNGIVSGVVPDMAIYNSSTSSVTVTVYIRSDSGWASPPSNTQLFVQASYLNNASTASRATVNSTETINTDGSTWVGFTCTMVPARAGWIYLKVYLGLYAAGEGILVDIKPVIS
jgi:hypothetical protein